MTDMPTISGAISLAVKDLNTVYFQLVFCPAEITLELQCLLHLRPGLAEAIRPCLP